MERKKVVIDLQQIDLLEQKVVKATEMIRTLRRERDALQGKLNDSQEALTQARKEAAGSEKERREFQEVADQLDVLREERAAIRGRVNRMLEMMSTLEEGAAGARGEH